MGTPSPHPTSCLSVRGSRSDNQDRCYVGNSTALGRPAQVLAVADGMGGHEGGARAAEIAIDAVRQYAIDTLPRRASAQDLRASVAKLFQDANQRVRDWGRELDARGGSGTTLVIAVVVDSTFLVASAGDSRCYYVSRWEARQLTVDHTRVQELVSRGSLTAEAAERSPYRHQLTNCLGQDAEIRVDFFPPTPHLSVADEPAVLLLCSDGLHGAVHRDQLRKEFLDSRDLDAAGDKLVSKALENGSSDNITLVAVELMPLATADDRIRCRASARRWRRLHSTMCRPAMRTGLSTPWLRLLGAGSVVLGGLVLLGLWFWGSRLLDLGLEW